MPIETLGWKLSKDNGTIGKMRKFPIRWCNKTLVYLRIWALQVKRLFLALEIRYKLLFSYTACRNSQEITFSGKKRPVSVLCVSDYANQFDTVCRLLSLVGLSHAKDAGMEPNICWPCLANKMILQVHMSGKTWLYVCIVICC